MKTIEGDLIKLAREGAFDVIVHGCNCFCTMGAGIAKQIRKYFPEAHQADLNTPMGEHQKLGSFSSAVVKRGGKQIVVVNAYTQFTYTGPGRLADYEAIQNVFMKIKLAYPGMKMAYPKIGAGLARGDWNKIAGIIDRALGNEDHTLVVLPGFNE